METYEYGPESALIVLIEPIGDHDPEGIEEEYNLIRQYTDKEFRLVTVKVDDWNRDLSPWKAPAVFGKEDFGDGAEEFLRKILLLCGDSSKSYVIGGYSLAGLFALWAACRTDVFQGVAAASPSAWFQGLLQYIREHGMKGKAVYLSLGDREEKTRNQVMATVGERIREIYRLLAEQKVNCTLEWNRGNHFQEPDVRTAKAFAWVMEAL
ncbi:MAG: esterase [Lachnospiraceae bacterium]|nr:esterase [Lachnospiraceae bacterium]